MYKLSLCKLLLPWSRNNLLPLKYLNLAINTWYLTMSYYFRKMTRLFLHNIVQTHKQIDLSRKELFGEVIHWPVSSQVWTSFWFDEENYTRLLCTKARLIHCAKFERVSLFLHLWQMQNHFCVENSIFFSQVFPLLFCFLFSSPNPPVSEMWN